MLKPEQKKPVTAAGWVEILYRFRPLDRLRSVEDLDPEDYMMVASFPSHEFAGVYTIYEHIVNCFERESRTRSLAGDPKEWFTPLPKSIPRSPERFDVLNMIFNVADQPSQIVSCLLIELPRDSHLIYRRAQVQYRRPMKLHALPLKQPSPLPCYAISNKL